MTTVVLGRVVVSCTVINCVEAVSLPVTEVGVVVGVEPLRVDVTVPMDRYPPEPEDSTGVQEKQMNVVPVRVEADIWVGVGVGVDVICPNWRYELLGVTKKLWLVSIREPAEGVVVQEEPDPG